MKRKTSLLILWIATTNFALFPALAQAEKIQHTAPVIPEEIISAPVFNEVEIGLGVVTNDAYKFGRYSGLQTDGLFVIGEINIENYSEDGEFLRLHATDIGLESRYLRAEFGEQGSYKVFLEYDELPNYKDNTAQTPFIGVGGSNLTLPSAFINIDANLDDAIHNFELKTRRERATVGINFIPKARWQFDVDFSHEKKQGVDATGASMANGDEKIVGMTTFSLLPEPVNYETNIVNAALSYAGEEGQLILTYHMSLFNAVDEYLRWTDPFDIAATGNMSLPPDNEFHQFSLTGSYVLPYQSTVTGLISIGRMTQNQKYQPYTINSSLPAIPLPRDSLGGEAWLVTTKLRLSSRPLPELRLNAEYSYNKRANQSPIDMYGYVAMDSFFAGWTESNPYSFYTNKVNLNANYRFNASSSLLVGYKYNDMDRLSTDVEREYTEENTLFAKWKTKPLSTVKLALYVEASNRNGDAYNSLAHKNPGLRKFHLADRERLKTGAKIDYVATGRLFLGLRADINRDEYNDTDIGLIEAIQPVYSFNFSYQPGLNISTYGFYTYQRNESSLAGYDITPALTSDWAADFDDIFKTVGIGAKINELGKWDLGLDVTYNHSRGKIELTDYVLPGTETPFPDNQTELTSTRLWADYNYDKHWTYKFGLSYEEYMADNWAVDGLLPYEPTVVANSLLPGNETLDYSTYVITLSANFKFR
ncbi:MtrB/PioB family decaheme-associated outer membrane protein [Pseudomonadota bacterium]